MMAVTGLAQSLEKRCGACKITTTRKDEKCDVGILFCIRRTHVSVCQIIIISGCKQQSDPEAQQDQLTTRYSDRQIGKSQTSLSFCF